MKCVGFDPICDRNARVLILGTLPGADSLRLGQYYANSRNNFWNIMGALTGANSKIAYDERLRILAKSGVALWDVYHSAKRAGSTDPGIQGRTAIVNNFADFFRAYPNIRLICFNGKAAEKEFRRKIFDIQSVIEIMVLPSTSPSNTRLTTAQKLECWRDALAKGIKILG